MWRLAWVVLIAAAPVPAHGDEAAAPRALPLPPGLPGCVASDAPEDALIWLPPVAAALLDAPPPRRSAERPDLGAIPGLILPGLGFDFGTEPDARDGGQQPRLTFRLGRCHFEATNIDLGRGEGRLRLVCPSSLLKSGE